ncbi:MAG: hypothetical protein KKG59_00650 [Nanoarchaeota archaeon]|nr:hypothetical protein [Nanoarchaeota archaeon]
MILFVISAATLVYEGQEPLGFVVYELRDDQISYYSNGNFSINFTIDSTDSYIFTITARGDLAGPDAPNMKLYVDENYVGNANVTGSWVTYEFYYNMDPGTHRLDIAYTNDYYNFPDDRNLYVDEIYLEGDYNLTPQIFIDFSNEVKEIDLLYGLNEKDRPTEYWNNSIVQDYYKDLDTRYVRIWVKDYNDPIKDLVAYNWSGSGQYNFSNFERNVQAVLQDIGAKVYIGFEGCPAELSQGNQCNGDNAPNDISGCADYMAATVNHFNNICTNGTWNFCGDFSDWYWGIYNEPDCAGGWANWTGNHAYITFFNEAYTRIKTLVPSASVGGWDSCGIEPGSSKLTLFLTESTPDFISWHNYNYDSKRISYTIPNNISAMIDTFDSTLPKILSEHNINGTWDPSTDPAIQNQQGAMWMGSALLWLIQTDVDLELFFEGTGHNNSWGFGLWSSLESENYMTTPAYDVRELFTAHNSIGSSIYQSYSHDQLTEVLAVQNPNKILTIVNRRNRTMVVNITTDSFFGDVNWLNNASVLEHTGINVKIPLEGLEVLFLELDDTYRSIVAPDFGILVDGVEYDDNVLTGVHMVTLLHDTIPRLNFSYDFTNEVLDLSDVRITASNSSRGSITVTDMTLEKDIYVPLVLNVTLCLKDSLNTTISEMCDGADEIEMNCTLDAEYECSLEPGFYVIRGLEHSAIKEFGCAESWNCSDYSDCDNGTQNRTCIDLNACGTYVNMPSENQSCNCTENWQCTSWSTCANSQQSRSCVDTNGCGIEATRPSELQACEEQSAPETTGGSPIVFKGGGSPSIFKGGFIPTKEEEAEEVAEPDTEEVEDTEEVPQINQTNETQYTGAYFLVEEEEDNANLVGEAYTPSVGHVQRIVNGRIIISILLFIAVSAFAVYMYEKKDYGLPYENKMQLHNFINEALNKGFSQHRIREKLRSVGWNRNLIYHEMDDVLTSRHTKTRNFIKSIKR